MQLHNCKKPSAKHPNRRHHNWLVYDLTIDKPFCANVEKFNGDLYDLGCGESPYIFWLSQHVTSYTGVDWKSINGKQQPKIIADLNKKLKIPNNVADTVISLSVLEHLCEPSVMIKEAYRILKSDGNLILQVPWQWWVHEAPYDYFRYTSYGLEYLLKQAGFKEIKIEAQSGFFTTLFLKINYFSLRLKRGPAFVRKIIHLMLLPFWFCNQKMAPYLDKIDKNWKAETCGYFVTARKF